MTARLNSDGEYEVPVVWDYRCDSTLAQFDLNEALHYWISFNTKKKPQVCKECRDLSVKVQPVKRRFDELLFGSYRCTDNHEWTRLGFYEEGHCIVRKCTSRVTGQIRPASIDDVVPSNEPLYGHFKCDHCYHTWTSAYSYRGYGQKCMKCGVDTLYIRPHLISHHKYGSGRDEEHKQEFCEKCEEMGQNCKKHFERSWDRQNNLDSVSELPANVFDFQLKRRKKKRYPISRSQASLLDFLIEALLKKSIPESDQESPQGASASLTVDETLLPPPQDMMVSNIVLPSSVSPPTDSDSKQHELSASLTHEELLLPPLQDPTVADPLLPTSTSPLATDPQSDSRPHELSVTEQDTTMPSPNDDSEDTNA